jgi:hypothetical protein
MFDDVRNHDPIPTAEEREWMAVDPLPIALRLAVVAGLSVLLGVAASQALEQEPVPATTVAAAQLER